MALFGRATPAAHADVPEPSRWHVAWELWETNFFTLTRDEQDRWKREILRRLPDATEDEVLHAIRDLGELFPAHRNPKLRHLLNRLLQFREAGKGPRPPNELSIEELKKEIENEEDHARIWSLVCKPDRYLDNRLLEEYAERVHPGWRRPILKFNLPELKRE